MNINRIYSEYSNKSKTVQWLNIIPSIASDFDNVFHTIRTSYDIDHAGSNQLDILGSIVGVDRSFESDVFHPIKSFCDYSVSVGQLGIQCQNPNMRISGGLSDSIFKMLIKSKITKNTNDVTLDGIIDALTYITHVQDIEVQDHENMTFSVLFKTKLTDIERFVLLNFDIVPKPQGVKFLGFNELHTATQMNGSQSYFGHKYSQFGLYF